MKNNKWIALGIASVTVLYSSFIPGPALSVFAEEDGVAQEDGAAEAEILEEEAADIPPQEDMETAVPKEAAAGTIQIEGIEIIESPEMDEKTEKKISSYLEEREAQRESEAEEIRKNLPEGFFVDPSRYPAADVNENTKIIYRYLTEELELNHAAACGILANIHLESSFRPLAFGDGGTSYGICQWHLGRFSSLVGYCRQNGLDYNTLEGQLAFMTRELETGYTGVLDYIKNVPDTEQGAYDAAYYWCVHFEMPDQSILRGQRRGNLAQNEYFPRDLSLLLEGETVPAQENKTGWTKATELDALDIGTMDSGLKIDSDQVANEILSIREVSEFFVQWENAGE